MYTKTETIAKEMSRSIQAFGASLAVGAITIAFGANKIACSPVIFLFPINKAVPMFRRWFRQGAV